MAGCRYYVAFGFQWLSWLWREGLVDKDGEDVVLLWLCPALGSLGSCNTDEHL